MKSCKLITLLLILTMVFALASESYADISNAAVLFLRIAPGARAAGMGEAFVAVADDATTTHWNPAGLGTYPLSDTWIETKIPKEYGSIKALAALKKGNSSDYRDYEIWAITDQGLIRYDHKSWNRYENFQTKTSQTVEDIISSYFNVTDKNELALIVRRVADYNSKKDLEYLNQLRDTVINAIPEDYSSYQSLVEGFDSVLAVYDQCRLNWDRIKETEELFEKGMKDSVLEEIEIERINFAIEKSKTRYIQEELKVPYDAYIPDDITAIASSKDFLLLGTLKGLISYNGKNWRLLTEEGGLPSNEVNCIHVVSKTALVGTSKGIARYSGLDLTNVPGYEQLPKGAVTAIGANGLNNIWIVLDNDLYRYNGSNWTNTTPYKVVLDDTPETIADKFSLYGLENEKEMFVTKFKKINSSENTLPGNMLKENNPDSTAIPVPEDSTIIEKENPVDTSQNEDTPEEPLLSGETDVEDTVTVSENVSEPVELVLTPGMLVDVPYVAEIKGDINAVYVDLSNRVWLGSDSGVMVFENNNWTIHGEGRKINSIDGQGDRIMLATDEGMVEYDGKNWRRFDIKDMDKAKTIGIDVENNELLMASDEKIVLKAQAHKELTFMHVKWLPDLADDLYYEFLSFVNDFEGWGTLGGNITYISYGKFNRTKEGSPEIVGEFDSFDIAFTLTYGTSLTRKLSGGVAAKIIYSRLADIGTAEEVGQGTATGFAVDFGLLYRFNDRLTLGTAITNIGPKMAYIDAAQSDDLPRNLAVGFAYKLFRSDYYQLLVTSEVNKIMVGLDDGFKEELKQLVVNTGAEFSYADIIALRAGYIWDDEGEIKTLTLGVGLHLLGRFKFDFAYIPSNSDVALANTLRVSISVLP